MTCFQSRDTSIGASEYLIADTDRILGTHRPPGTMHKSDQLSVLAKKKVAKTEQSGVWNHCANVASREISSSSSRRLGGCWSVSCSKLQFLQTDKLKLLTGPPEHRCLPGLALELLEYLQTWCLDVEETGREDPCQCLPTLPQIWLEAG